MAVKLEKFEHYKKMTVPVYKVPKSVQQSIPISQIAKEGIFKVENKQSGSNQLYDKAYVFLDTNYSTKDLIQREEFLKLYCKLLNTLSVSYKILTMNLNRDMVRLQRDILLKHKEGEPKEHGALIDNFNQIITNRVSLGCSGIEQVKVFVISCQRQTFEEAKAFFRTIESSLQTNFKKLESGLIPMDATERLHLLHNFYRLGKEDKFNFDWDTACTLKRDWRSDICNTAIKEHKDYLEFEDKFVQVMFAKTFPSSLSDEFMTELTSVPFHTITTLDVAPIPKPVAQKKLMDMYLANGRSIEKQQEQRNKHHAWSSEISYDKQQERDEIKEYMDIMRNGDENMFFVGLYVVIIADTLEELRSHALTIESIGNGVSIEFLPHVWNQLKAMNTSLPVCSREVDTMRTLFTQPLSSMVPFNVQELCDPNGIFYGSNRVSKNIIIGDRKGLPNGNGFILAVTGGGKSVEAKLEMIQVCVNTSDDVIVVDPQNEYSDICNLLRGQYMDISATSKNHINPLDPNTITLLEDQTALVADKAQFIMGICEQIMMHEVTAGQKSIVDRCLGQIYEEYFNSKSATPPTMHDLYTILEDSTEPEAKEVALALERFVKGSLNVFANPTNVDTRNRFTVYGTRDLGEELSGVGMLIMLESIRARIAENFKKGVATWLFIDEFHNLVGSDIEKHFTTKYLFKVWKEVRKLGGLCTGITQNVVDLLVSKTVETMLANSEYICLLRQGETDIEELERVLRLNENELQYVRGSEKGCGLMRFGDKIIPKDNRLPKKGLLYDLLNTDFHEIQANKKKLKPKKIVQAVDSWREEKKIAAESESADTTIPEENKFSYATLDSD